MNILLIAAGPKVSRTLGATKVTLDVADSLKKAGAKCKVFPDQETSSSPETFISDIEEFIKKESKNYDIIEVPDTLNLHIDSSPHTIVVCRSVLLGLHQKYIKYPTQPTTLKSKISTLVFGHFIRKKKSRWIENESIELTERLQAADFINVANSRDKFLLENEGFSPEKIILQGYGLQSHRFEQLANFLAEKKSPANIVFLGTFDFRKGCLDIVDIFSRVLTQIPEANLTLLGTKGLMTNPKQVLSYFDKSIRSKINVVETFKENDLPSLLSDCSVGIFPSYWEGFGIGVVEMLAAGIPVIAYDAPGPCDILPPKWLVEPGDKTEFSANVIQMIRSLEKSSEARTESVEISKKFNWDKIGFDTFNIYKRIISDNKNRHTS